MQNKITKYLKVNIFTLDECFKGQQELFKIFIDPILKDHKVKLLNNIFNDYHIMRLCRISDEISKFDKNDTPILSILVAISKAATLDMILLEIS